MKTILASAAILASLVAAPAFAAAPAKPLPTTITKQATNQTAAKPAIKVSGKAIKHATLLRKHRVHAASARKPAIKKVAPAVTKS